MTARGARPGAPRGGRVVDVEGVRFGGGTPVAIIAGPCMLESEALALRVAEEVRDLCAREGLGYVFKGSYDKANRSSLDAPRGPGLRRGLRILERVKSRIGVPILSDVHCREDVEAAGDVLDVIQIPAFLCRQTDLLLAAGRTRRAVNVKKGQFLSPWDMEHVVRKVASTGNRRILVSERGASFGYRQLVADMRSLVVLRDLGYPVVFDATHSVQSPGGLGNASGGDRRFVPHLARAAAGVGIDGLFLEVHPDPDRALSDGPNSVPLAALGGLLRQVREIDRYVKDEIRAGRGGFHVG